MIVRGQVDNATTKGFSSKAYNLAEGFSVLNFIFYRNSTPMAVQVFLCISKRKRSDPVPSQFCTNFVTYQSCRDN